MDKLKSRKFWLAVCSMLISFGMGISGFVVGAYSLAGVGTFLCVLAAAIYSAINTYQTVQLETYSAEQLIQPEITPYYTYVTPNGEKIATSGYMATASGEDTSGE